MEVEISNHEESKLKLKMNDKIGSRGAYKMRGLHDSNLRGGIIIQRGARRGDHLKVSNEISEDYSR